MCKRAVAVAAVPSPFSQAPLRADQNATYNGPLSVSERHFVAGIQSDLMKRFPTSADDVRAGYVRYTNENDTGAISYANVHWTSADPEHPSQLWYWVGTSAKGSPTYDNYIMARDFRARGGEPAHPTRADIVRIGRAEKASDVTTVFGMPSIWDLIVWLKPNPNGAFAEKNPTVKPQVALLPSNATSGLPSAVMLSAHGE
jgi:hypothetical protein